MAFRPRTLPFTLLLGALGALPPLATDMGLPALGAIGAGLGVPEASAALTLSVFMVGFAAGPLLYAPLSDRIGRRPVLLAGCGVFAVGGLLCALAPSLPALLVARLVQGAGAGAGLVLAFAIVRDLFEGHEARAQMSWVSVVLNIAPIVAPSVGALLLPGGWRLIYAAMAAAGALLCLAVLLGYAETRHPPAEAVRTPLLRAVLPGYARVLGNRACLGHVLANGGNFGALFAYITGSPLVLIGALGVSPRAFALMFALAALGIMGGAALSGRLARRRVAPSRPLLAGLVIGAACGLGVLALSGRATLPLILPLLVLNAAGRGLVGPNATHGALRPLPELAGSASAVLGGVQMLCGALAGALVSALSSWGAVAAMGVGMTLFAALALAGYLLVAAPAERRAEVAAGPAQ